MTLLSPAGPNLLCFPYAGASPLAFYQWRKILPVCLVSYPEGAESVQDVVGVLMSTLAPTLRGKRFAFFGHSMGAGVAFEFTRALRREGFPLPAGLLVSSATAPQLRTRAVPDATEEELLAVLARIHPRISDSSATSEATLRMLFTRFAPDARIHRRYVYREEPPLDIPIRTYGGTEDPTVPTARLEPWAEQTRAGFRLRLFSGGHMYLEQPNSELPATLREDLNEILPG